MLLRALDPAVFQVSIADLGVVTRSGIRYPDLDVADRPDGELATDAPLFIAEVLSPSSLGVDLVEKTGECLALPSLVAYLVVAQDEPRAWLWSRTSAGWPAAPAMTGGGAAIEVPQLALTLRLGEVF